MGPRSCGSCVHHDSFAVALQASKPEMKVPAIVFYLLTEVPQNKKSTEREDYLQLMLAYGNPLDAKGSNLMRSSNDIMDFDCIYACTCQGSLEVKRPLMESCRRHSVRTDGREQQMSREMCVHVCV